MLEVWEAEVGGSGGEGGGEGGGHGRGDKVGAWSEKRSDYYIKIR